MPWVKLDDGFFSNPKVIKAPPLARALYVAGLCHCSGGLTDGQVAKAAIPLLLAQTGAKAAAAAELVKVGLWHEDADHYEVNDWAHFNQTAADISVRRKAEREKKARQRSSGAAKVAKGPGGRFVSRGDSEGDDPRDTRRDTRRDTPHGTGGPSDADSVGFAVGTGENDEHVSAGGKRSRKAVTSENGSVSRRDSLGESPATRPDPTQLSTSSDNFKGVEPAVAGAEAPPEEDPPPNPETTADAAVTHMAQCDLARARADGTPIRNESAYLAKLTDSRRSAHLEQLLTLAETSTDPDPVNLAERIDPQCGPLDGGTARSAERWRNDRAYLDDLADQDARNAEQNQQVKSLLADDDVREVLLAQVIEQHPDATPAMQRLHLKSLAFKQIQAQETSQ